MGINKGVKFVHPVRGEKKIPFPFSIRIRVASHCVTGRQSFGLLSLCFLDLLKSLQSSFGVGPEKLEVNLNSRGDKIKLRRVQDSRQVESYPDFRKLFQLDWLGCFQQPRALALELSAQGEYLLSYNSFPLWYPEPGTGPVIA